MPNEIVLNLLGPGQGIAITSTVAQDNLGLSLSSAGDVNGDGIADLLLGLIQPQGGQIRLNGKDLSSVIGHFRKRIICVSQTPFLADTTIAANVAFGCQEIDPELVWNCLRSAQLEDYVRSLPEALETTLGERGVKLSGGQRQRIGIAR